MKSKRNVCAAVLALMLAGGTGAQTIEESYKAFENKDYAAALSGFTKLANQNNTDAQCLLAMMYTQGLGVGTNDVKPAYWFRQAAELDDPQGQLAMGSAYANGIGVEQDEKQFRFWYQKAAEHGQVNAQFNLGQSFLLDKNEHEAATWLELAVAQSHAEARFALGML